MWILGNEGRVVCRQKSTRVDWLSSVGMETGGAERPEDNQRDALIIGSEVGERRRASEEGEEASRKDSGVQRVAGQRAGEE